MATRPDQVLHHLRQLVCRRASASLADAELVQRFARDRDEDAFAELLARHGGMVLGVCRRVLHDPQEAEDVAQATWLVLARKAASLRSAETVAAWLHGVAHHLALKSRRAEARRRRRETRGRESARAPAAPDPLDQLTARELLVILDEELQRLPAVYRLPLILCVLEGRSAAEAAAQLGWSPGAVRGRLLRGRERLRGRLGDRGVAPAGALMALEGLGTTNIPLGWVTATRKVVMAFRTGTAGTSARVMALAEGGLPTMTMTPGKKALVILLMATLTAGAAVRTLLPASPPSPPGPPRRHPVAETHGPKAAVQRRDSFGDPLPPEAVRRIGSVHFRPGDGVWTLLTSPDGKLLISGAAYGGRTVCIWEAATGRLLHRLPGEIGHQHIALSADGTILAASDDEGLCLWQPATGRRLRRVKGKLYDTLGMACSPDGRMLATCNLTDIYLWDATTGAQLARLPWRRLFTGQVFLRFTPDAKKLLVHQMLDPTVHVWDVATRRQRDDIDLGAGRYVNWMTLSGDGRLLATEWRERKDQRQRGIALWNVADGKEVRQLVWKGQFCQALAFSPDGRRLAFAEGASGAKKHVGWWDLTTGKLLHTVEADAWALTFSRDGKTLFGGRNAIRRWDVATGKEIQSPAGMLRPIQAVVVTADGRTLASCTDEGVWLWDAATGKLLHAFTPPREMVSGCALSPDGKTLAVVSRQGLIHLLDTATGKEVRVIRTPLRGKPVYPGQVGEILKAVVFAPDGKSLATSNYDGTVCVWDAQTGKEVRCIKRGGLPLETVAWSADGKLLFAAGKTRDGTKVIAWETFDGKELGRLTAAMNARMEDIGTERFAFYNDASIRLTADGRMLTVNRERSIGIWEVASGKERLRLKEQPEATRATAFSPDGRTLAAAYQDGSLRLWDLTTGAARGELSGHRGKVRTLTFSPVGRFLYSGGEDTSVLVWDTARIPRRPLPPPARPDAATAWRDLASADAARAYRAAQALRAHPATALPLLRKHLRPVEAVEAKRLSGLIALLQADQFAARERAFRALAELDERAEPALRGALRDNPTIDLRRRIHQLLEKLALPDTEHLRRLRAVEVLEAIGTREARQLLKELARGQPQARLTREARASLSRLAKGRPAGP